MKKNTAAARGFKQHKKHLLGAIGMVSFFWIPAAITGAASLVSNLLNKNTANKNLAAQQEQQQWEREQTEITRQREDTAVQRRVNDLQAAGLSPVLAAGSAAETSQPIHSEAPQDNYQADFGNDIMKMLQAGQSAAQTKLIEEQKNQLIFERQLEKDKFEEQKNQFQQGHMLDREKFVANVKIAEDELGLGQRNLDQRQIEHRDQLVELAKRLGFDEHKFEQQLNIALADLANNSSIANIKEGQYLMDIEKQSWEKQRATDLHNMREITTTLVKMRAGLMEKDLKWYEFDKISKSLDSLIDLINKSQYGY